MARAKAILQSEFPYNIGARCINRDWFQIPMEDVWSIFCEALTDTNKKSNLLIHSFVLMNNHFHLIASTPDANVSQCMHRLMSLASRRLTSRGNRINQTFGGRHFKCILNQQSFYLNAYKYNFRNPVTANICSLVEDYPFSTLQFFLGKRMPKFPILEDETYLSDPVGTLKWLNEKPETEKLEAVRYGLKRAYFTSKKCSLTNKPILGINDTL